ncbi:MAG: hypothetical protein ACM3U2_17405 [Deltaproteobacteria bacterium]
MQRKSLLVALAFLVSGCGRVPQVDPANRKLMLGLQSAVSSRKLEWLEATAKLVDEKLSNGELSDEEYAAFEPIIEKARAGDWDGAQKDAFALSEGQKPTAEDLEKIRPGAAGK